MTLDEAGPERDLLRRRDAEARLAAQRDFDHPLVLVAGAGTGKTAALVARIVCWCLGPGWDKAAGDETPLDEIAPRVLEGVVAITFTEAAAAEMAQRVAQALAAVEVGAPPKWLDLAGAGLAGPEQADPDWTGTDWAGGETARRARRLLTHLDRLHTSTIHAFCRRLLAAHPLEAGLHPAFTVDAEGDALDEAVREAVEEHLARAYAAPGDPHALGLAAEGIGPPELAEATRTLVASGLPPAALEEDPFGPEPVRALAGQVRRALDELYAAGAQCLEEASGRASITLAAAETLAALRRHLEERAVADRPGLQALCDLLRRHADGRVRKRLEAWAAGSFNQTEEGCLGARAEGMARACAGLVPLVGRLRHLEPELFHHARLSLAPLVRAVRQRLRERGVATFQDLLTGARDLLDQHPDVRRIERRKIHQLLVDELQDTDRLQCQILRRLALEGPAGERPGLFLVGDPKQSIYGWRDADLEAYDRFVAEVKASGGREHDLVVSFRSVPAVLSEVERLIAPVMVPEPGLQPPFQPLLPCAEREEDPGFQRAGRGPVEHWISWLSPGEEGGGAATRSSQATELEARALARELRQLHEAGELAWPDAALLLRTASDLEVYLRAFQEEDVPYAVARDRSYYRRREVMEAAALVRAVLDPADHLALLTALRAPWVGVPDAALLPLWEGGLPELVTELLRPDPERLGRARTLASRVARCLRQGAYREIPGLAALDGWERSLTGFLATLAQLRQSFAEQPAHRFVESLRTATLIEATEAARFLGAWRLANLDRFFRQLARTLDEGADADALVRFLRRAVSESRETQEGRPREAAEQAVQVMTIHAAKGLGFRHVYVAQLHKRPAGGGRGGRRTAARELAAGSWQLLLFGAPSPGWWQAEEREERVRAAEQVRLLYVAATRAADRLVLAGKAAIKPRSTKPRPAKTSPNKANGVPGRADSFAELLPFRRGWPADLAGLQARLQAAAEAALPSSGERAGPHSQQPSGPPSELDADGVRWVFPQPPGEAQPPPERAAAPGLQPPEELARDAAELARRREEAAARMARPFRGAASHEAHRELAELFAARAEEEEAAGEAGSGHREATRREVATLVGSGIHRLLERFELAAADPSEELDRRRQELDRYLAGLLAGAELEAARERAGGLLEHFTGGRLWRRFLALRGHVVARELAVLLPPPGTPGEREIGPAELPPPAGEEVEERPSAPVGVIAGAVDLLYRDPDTGELVVADYKTDDLPTEADLQARAAAYLHQGQTYRRAVQEALDLPTPPRLELWFLAADRIWTAGDAAAEPTESRPGQQLRLF